MKTKFFINCFIILLLIILSPNFTWSALEDYVEIVNYKIDVKLDTEAKTVSGTEHLIWLNDSDEKISELQFHLYGNCFKNNKSTIAEEGIRFKGLKKKEDWGWIDIHSFKLENGEELVEKIEYIQPDDDNIEDQTVIRIPLSDTLLPNEHIAMTIDFTYKLPKCVRRSGYHNDNYVITQWFPKIAVYEEIGECGATKSAWNCHQFHKHSEFYADFGVYEVTFTVPKTYIVGATGELKSKTETDTTATYTYYQDKIHDFAWTADPNYEIYKEIWTHPKVNHDVEIIFLAQPNSKQIAPRVLTSIKYALEYTSTHFGPYPYNTITCVDPARGSAGGGMEYPTFFTTFSSNLSYFWPFNSYRFAPEDVTIHEFGHNYWYGIVATNEFENAWMDEGFNTYTCDITIMDAYYGEASQFDFLGLFKLNGLGMMRISYANKQYFDTDPMQTYSWKFYSRYGTYSYNKPALMLYTLEHYLGQDIWSKIMRTYYEHWSFRHPAPNDFFDIVNEITGEDYTWFFEQAVYTTKVLDYAIGDTYSSKKRDSRGFFDTPSGEKEYINKDEADTTLYHNVIHIIRRGEMTFPVIVEIKFEDEEPFRENWDGIDRYKKFEYYNPNKLEYATIDPDNKIMLDVRLLNNSIIMKNDYKVGRKWADLWSAMLQFIMIFITIFL